MKPSSWVSLITLGLLAQSPVLAAGASKVEQQLAQKLAESFPELKNLTVTKSEAPNLYQVTSGPLVFFISKDGKYLFSGDLIDLDHNQFNITESIRKKATVKALNSFGESNMIVFAPSDKTKIKHVVTVFTDVDCGYCQKFHQQIDEYKNLGFKVRYMLYPRSPINTPTYDTSLKIWCSKDKQSALTKAKAGQALDNPICQTKNIENSVKLGAQAGVRGTPTIIFEDGSVIPGYLPPVDLLKQAQMFENKKMATHKPIEQVVK